MMRSIWEDAKREYRQGNMVTRLILVNIVVFVLINLVWLIMRLACGCVNPEGYTPLVRFFSMPADPLYLLTHPWTPFTSMFLHTGFFHILWNMLYLYWFGRIVVDFIGNQRILPLYLLGGFAGALAFFLASNLGFPFLSANGYALGASAAVMSVAVASATINPDYEMHLLFLGPVKLKWLVGALVLLDILFIGQDGNTGGHLAHLGGALMGFITIRQLQQGNDWSAGINRVVDSIADFLRRFAEGPKSKKGPRVAYRNPRGAFGSKKGNKKSDTVDQDHQQKLDAILEKIKKSGYDSLSKDEKEFLFKASKK